MPKCKEPELTPAEQYKRFKEAARALASPSPRKSSSGHSGRWLSRACRRQLRKPGSEVLPTSNTAVILLIGLPIARALGAQLLAAWSQPRLSSSASVRGGISAFRGVEAHHISNR